MDNFDFKKYLKEGRINKDFSQLDEKKQDSKKGNKEEQKRMEGAIRDNRDHIKSLEKDIKADEKKLAKLKSDEPKDVNEMKKQGYDDREDESLGARKGAEKDKKVSMKGRRDDSYGKIGKRDAEAKGKAKGPGKNKINKESQEVDESLAVAAGVASIFGGAAALNKIMDKLEKGDLGEKGKSIAKSLASLGSAASSVREESQEVDESLAVAAGVASIFGGAAALNKIMDKLEKGDLGEKGKSIAKSLASLGSAASSVKKEGYSPNYEEDDIDPMNENARTDAEEEGYEDGFKDAKADMKDALTKMKVSELKAKIRETILSELSEESQYNASIYSEAEEDVDVDVDVEDEVNVDVEPDEIDIEKKAVRTTVDVGLSPEEEVIQDSLKAAMDSANALGNDKLADQIGNTITFFTREYVVGRNTD